MYTKNNQTLSLEEAEANASAAGMELNDWASTFGWSSEGKQNDSTETDPPANQNTETSVGESNSGDISLGSPVVKSEESYMGMGAAYGTSLPDLPIVSDVATKEQQRVQKAADRLRNIDVSDEFLNLEKGIDEVTRVPIMTETARGTMSATGGFYETRVYDDYIEPAKNQLGEGADYVTIEEKAKSLYLNAQRKSLINDKAEEILEDFDDAIYSPLGRIKKHLSGLSKFGGVDEGDAQRAMLVSEINKSKEKEFARIDALSADRAAQETYLVVASETLNTLQDKYENDPESITEEDVTTYNNVSTSYNNVLDTYKQTFLLERL